MDMEHNFSRMGSNRLIAFLLLMVLAVMVGAQPAPPLIRNQLTTNADGTIYRNLTMRGPVLDRLATNRAYDGGAGGSFLSVGEGGAISGVFTNRIQDNAVPPSIKLDYWELYNATLSAFGLNVWDMDTEEMIPVYSNTNASGNKDFRFYQSVALDNLTANKYVYPATTTKVLTPSAYGDADMASLVNTVQYLGGDEENILIDDFSKYTATDTPQPTNGFGWSSNGIITGASKIVPRVWLDGKTRNVLQLYSKGGYTRPWPWGTNWVKLRVGILWGVTNTGATFTNTYAFGVTKATNGGYFNPSVVSWFGTANDIASSSQSFFYSNNLQSTYYDNLRMASEYFQKTNNVRVSAALSGSGGRGVAALPNYSAFIIEVLRPLASDGGITNQTYTINVHAPDWRAPSQVSGVPTPVNRRPSLGSLIYACKQTSSGGVINGDIVIAAASGAAIPAATRFFGEFDSVNFSWGGNDALCEVAAIVVVKVY